ERIIELYSNELINNDLLEKQMNKLNAEKAKLINDQRSTLEEETQTITEDMLANIQSDFEDLEFKDKQAIIQTFIKEIHLDGDNVIIDWRF
ncbi:recombinase family protein, partial [Bacillus sp. mrc49]